MDKTKTVPSREWKDTKLQEQTRNLIGAYDEQQRTFDALRNAYLTDEARQEAIDAYNAASTNFDKLRGALGKK